MFRLRAPWALSFGLGLGFASALFCVDATAQDATDEPELTREVCRLGSGMVVSLETETQKACGRSCSQTEIQRVRGPNDQAWLTIENDSTDEEGAEDEPSADLSCERGNLQLTEGDVKLTLRPGPDGGFKLGPEPKASIAAAWRRPPATDPNETSRRERLAALLDRVTYVAAAESPNLVEGPVPELAGSLRLLAARDQLERGAWESAEGLLEQVEREKDALSAALQSRGEALRSALQAARERSAPLHLVDRHRIGSTRDAQKLPTEIGESPTLFWQGEALCVVQEDSSPKAMRCYQAQARRWGPALPLALPVSSGAALKMLSPSPVLHCDGFFVTQNSVPDGESPCDGGPGEPAEGLVSVVERDAMLFARGSGFSLARAKAEASTTLSAEQASAMVRGSAGSLLLGGSHYLLLPDARLSENGGDAEKRWNVLGAPATGEHWLGSGLASPNQRWVVAQSRALEGRFSLWLFRVDLAHSGAASIPGVQPAP